MCVHNVSDCQQLLRVDLDALPFPHRGQVRDLVTGAAFPVNASGELLSGVAPYQVLWLTGKAKS